MDLRNSFCWDFAQRCVLDDVGEQSLAFAVRCARIIPELAEIRRHDGQPLAGGVVENDMVPLSRQLITSVKNTVTVDWMHRWDTLAIESSDGKRLAVTVPAQEIIEVIRGPRPDDKRMIDVRWNGRVLVMFVEDVPGRGQEITNRKAGDRI